MAGLPVIEEIVTPDAAMALHAIGGEYNTLEVENMSRVSVGERRFLVYPPTAGFDILDDIDHAPDFAVEPNIFFSPRFCVPALPRLEDKHVRLMVLQDGDRNAPLTRFVMPFTVEKPGFAVGPAIVRAWSNPYGPFGVPILERREAGRIVEDLFATLALKSVELPKVIAFPDVPMDSPVVSLLRSVAIANSLPVATTKTHKRPVLNATLDSELYFHEALSGHHRRNYNRLLRQLEDRGKLRYTIARSPDQVRVAMEEFLLLENKGWKGERRTSLASDRYRGAFAREAINSLADRDKCRIHAFELDGVVIASLIVFVESNRAWTWKTAYDEDLSQFSPGTLLMMRATETFLDDPNILFADSCAVSDHPVMSRLWNESREMTTLVIGVDPSLERDVRKAANQFELYSQTRTFAKQMRDRLALMARKR